MYLFICGLFNEVSSLDYTKVTICPQFSGTVPEIKLMSHADFIPYFAPRFFRKIMHIEIYIEYEIYTVISSQGSIHNGSLLH
jgi:hypothetical protein